MPVELQELNDLAKKNSEGLEALTKNFNGLIDRLSKTPANNNPNASGVFGLPFARRGEDPLSSRGFSFMKMIGLITGAIPADEGKVELDIHNRLHNVYCKELGGAGYEYRGGGHEGVHRFLAPLSTAFMHERMVPRDFRREMKELVRAGMDGADQDEMGWIRKKQLMAQGYGARRPSCMRYGS